VEAAEEKKKEVDLKAVKKDILAIIENLDYDDGSYGPLFIRLAWHASGTYDKTKKTGGSNGAGMRFAPESDWGANAGLGIARGLLEKVKQKHPEISYSDLWIYAGYVALESMGGPTIPMRLGRVDYPDGKKYPLPDGLLPDATQGAQHLRDVFGRQGFNDQEIVALSGAHGLGRCHADRSGFVGPWTNAPTTFSNEFFRVLLEEKWVKEKAPNGAFQYWNAKTHTLMMLPTDLALIEDPSFRGWVEKYNKDEKLFFSHFASAFQKLTENGVPAFQSKK
jgi:cytochrome c peroxidase